MQSLHYEKKGGGGFQKYISVMGKVVAIRILNTILNTIIYVGFMLGKRREFQKYIFKVYC